MTRIAHIFRELVRNLYRNAGTALASILSMTLLFLLFDLFWIAAGTSDRFYRELLSEIEVEVYIDGTVADSSVALLSRRILSTEGVFTATYVSREDARAKLADLVDMDLLVRYEDNNPLPRSFLVRIQPEYLNSTDLAAMQSEFQNMDGISEIYYGREWLKKAEDTKSVFLEIGLVLGLLILGTVLVSSTNSIRLMTRVRAVGFRQMMLLGAGRLFVSFPFIIEGFLIGGVSAVAGWLIVLYGSTRIQFSQIEIVFPTTDEMVIFCAIAALLGGISGYFGVRKLLKE
ncbi:MAG: hypothetical protein DRP45_00460 [Candidatus Zixiibacteriota bacterium]|nr:MAG: hypothetical protein DRP45_00460 [candidate division Zixibacteria bacterium]